MVFEFDPEKSKRNKKKHGIDFVEAQQLWLDPDLAVLSSLHVDEPRKLIIGRLHSKTWTAIVTTRGEKIRIISVRRARESEVAIYEERED